MYVTFGLWTVSNIEVIIKNGEDIKYCSLPKEISLLLLNREIANLIYQADYMSSNIKILNLISDGRFNEILSLNQKIMKELIISKDNRSNLNKESLNLIKILPILYTKINSFL